MKTIFAFGVFGILGLQSQAQMLNFASWQQNLSLAFTTAPQSVLNKLCSGIVTIQSQRSGGVAYNLPANLTIDLTGPSNLTFFSDSACATPITSVTITSGSSSASFYFLDTVNSSSTITATAPSYPVISQTQTLSTNGFVWTGAVSSLWSTAGNWSGGVVPAGTNIAVFDGSCSTNCSPTFAGSISVRGLRMSLGYTGTIAQTADINLGIGGFVQISGTFSGSTNVGDDVVITDGEASISGGTFTAPVSNFSVGHDWRVLNSPTVTFPVGSTLTLSCANSTYRCYMSGRTFVAGSVTYRNLTIAGRRTGWNFGGATVNVTGNFIFGSSQAPTYSLDNGTINVSGDITLSGSAGYTGNAPIVAVGNPAGQTITGIAGLEFPILRIEAGANPVTFSGTIRTRGYTMTSVGTFTATGSTLQLFCSAGWTGCQATTATISPGSVTYDNVTITGYNTSYNLSGETFNISGDLILGDQNGTGNTISNGSMSVSGDVTLINNGYTSTSPMVIAGNVLGQTVTGLAGRNFPRLEIAAGANPVTLSGTIRARSYTVTSVGTLTTTGSTIIVYCTAGWTDCQNMTNSIAPGAFTYNNFSISGYATSYDLGGATLNLGGDFTYGDRNNTGRLVSNGTINVGGNSANVDFGYRGSARIHILGNAAGQTVTGLAGVNSLPMTINAGANNVTLSGTIRLPSYALTSVGTLTTTGSTLNFICASGWTECDNQTVSITLGSASYNNLTFRGYRTAYDFGGGTYTVLGNFTFGDQQTSNYALNNATFNIGGNLTLTDEGYGGSAILVATGNALGQTITGISAKRFPMLEIAAGTNPVTLSGSIRTQKYTLTSVGTFTSTGSTLDIRCISGFVCDNATVALRPGSVLYNDVRLEGYRTTWDLGGQTWNIGGNLVIDEGFGTLATSKIQNGSLALSGNLTVASPGDSGNATLSFVGSGVQTVTSGFPMPTGHVTVNQGGGGSISLASNVSWNAAGQNLTINSGNVNMLGFSLTVNGTMTIGTGTTVTRGGGTLTTGTLVNNGTLNP